jgi:hypothetical protein
MPGELLGRDGDGDGLRLVWLEIDPAITLQLDRPLARRRRYRREIKLADCDTFPRARVGYGGLNKTVARFFRPSGARRTPGRLPGAFAP